MRAKYLFLSLAATTLVFSACNPRDNKVTKPGAVVSTTGAKLPEPKFENYKYVAVLVERQVEVLELFKAISDEAFRGSRGMKLDPGVIEANSETRSGVTRKLSLLADVTRDESGLIKKMVFTQNDKSPSSEVAEVDGKKIELSLISKTIVIEKNDKGSFDVSYTSLARIDSLSTGGKARMVDNLSFNFSVDDSNLETFKIHAMTLMHVRANDNLNANADMQTKPDTEAGLTIEMKNTDKCAAINGVLTLESVDTKNGKAVYSNQLTYNQSDVSIFAGRTMPPMTAAACDVRPAVDLKKLF